MTTTLTVDSFASQIHGPSDLFGKKVATVAGTTSAKYLTGMGVAATELPTINDCYTALKQDGYEAVVFDSPVLQYYVAQDRADVAELAGTVFQAETYGLGATNCVRRSMSHCSKCVRTAPSTGSGRSTKRTLHHVRFPTVFALGDAGSAPNSKTGAAIRKQAPVVVDNIDAHLKGRSLPAGATTATPPARPAMVAPVKGRFGLLGAGSVHSSPSSPPTSAVCEHEIALVGLDRLVMVRPTGASSAEPE